MFSGFLISDVYNYDKVTSSIIFIPHLGKYYLIIAIPKNSSSKEMFLISNKKLHI